VKLTRISAGMLGIAVAMTIGGCKSEASSGKATGGTPTAATATSSVSEQRRANFKQIAKANKAINDELKKPSPALDVIKTNARVIDGLAPKVPSWFPAGSGTEADPKSEALPAVWQQPGDFKKAAARLASTAHALQLASASGDLGKIKAAAPELGASCKACHDKFRAKK
jgi:cytochrome c556